MVSRIWQRTVSRHGLLDLVYTLKEHLNSVQLMVSGEYCKGLFPDTVCWTRWRNTWETEHTLLTAATFSHCLGPQLPESRGENFCFLAREICRGFFVKFLVPIFPGNWRTKIGEKNRNIFTAFFADFRRKILPEFHSRRFCAFFHCSVFSSANVDWWLHLCP